MLQHRVVHCTNLFQFLLAQSYLPPHMYHSVGMYVYYMCMYGIRMYGTVLHVCMVHVCMVHVCMVHVCMVLMMLQSSTDRYQLLPTPPLYWWPARFTCNCVTEVTECQVNQQSAMCYQIGGNFARD